MSQLKREHFKKDMFHLPTINFSMYISVNILDFRGILSLRCVSVIFGVPTGWCHLRSSKSLGKIILCRTLQIPKMHRYLNGWFQNQTKPIQVAQFFDGFQFPPCPVSETHVRGPFFSNQGWTYFDRTLLWNQNWEFHHAGCVRKIGVDLNKPWFDSNGCFSHSY